MFYFHHTDRNHSIKSHIVTLNSLEKRMLIYVLDLFDGGRGAGLPPIESVTEIFCNRSKNWKWINWSNKNKKNAAKVCHLYFWSNNSALFEHWNWKSSFKHRWMVCFRSKKGGKNLIFLHLFFKLCQICSHYLMK